MSLPSLPWARQPQFSSARGFGAWLVLSRCLIPVKFWPGVPRWISDPCFGCFLLLPRSLDDLWTCPIGALGLGLLVELCPAAGSAGGLWGGRGPSPSWGSLTLLHPPGELLFISVRSPLQCAVLKPLPGKSWFPSYWFCMGCGLKTSRWQIKMEGTQFAESRIQLRRGKKRWKDWD